MKPVNNSRKGRSLCGLATALLCAFLLLPGSVRAQEKQLVHEEKFSTGHELKGLFGSCEEYFRIGDWEIDDARLTLYYSATMLVREEISDFTVSLNGEPIYSQKVPLTGGETQELTISLPKRLLKEGANSVRIESYLRTSEDSPCEDDVSGANWMIVREESHVSIAYRPAAGCADVADAYRRITSIEGLENGTSAVFLQEGTTENELTAAAYLLTGIARNAALSYDGLKLVKISGAEDLAGYSYGAYVCEYDRLPEGMKALLGDGQASAAEEGAVIAHVKPEEGTELLLVTGRDMQALQNACRLFGNQQVMEQPGTVWRKISSAEDVSCVKETQDTVRLTQQGSYLSGPFTQKVSFTVPMSANKRIAAGSEAQIYMRYAQNLDFDRSLVTVSAGGAPLGSKKLEKGSANGDMLKVSIPDNLDITGRFTLEVTFQLEMLNPPCQDRRRDMPWAYITPDSTVSLRTQEVSWLLFDYYPGPFLYEGRLNEVAVILPVRESEEDLEAMRRILLTIGRYQTDNAGSVRVCRADHMGNLGAANIISIGCLADNPIVRQMNDRLYFSFSPKGTTINSNEKMKIEPNYGATLGTAQLLYSPYSTDRHALLIVSGVTKEGMLSAADYLGSVEKNWQIYGDGFITDGVQVHCFRFGEDNGKRSSLAAELSGASGVGALLITGGCVLALMGISLILIWRKNKRGR